MLQEPGAVVDAETLKVVDALSAAAGAPAEPSGGGDDRALAAGVSGAKTESAPPVPVQSAADAERVEFSTTACPNCDMAITANDVTHLNICTGPPPPPRPDQHDGKTMDKTPLSGGGGALVVQMSDSDTSAAPAGALEEIEKKNAVDKRGWPMYVDSAVEDEAMCPTPGLDVRDRLSWLRAHSLVVFFVMLLCIGFASKTGTSPKEAATTYWKSGAPLTEVNVTEPTVFYPKIIAAVAVSIHLVVVLAWTIGTYARPTTRREHGAVAAMCWGINRMALWDSRRYDVAEGALDVLMSAVTFPLAIGLAGARESSIFLLASILGAAGSLGLFSVSYHTSPVHRKMHPSQDSIRQQKTHTALSLCAAFLAEVLFGCSCGSQAYLAGIGGIDAAIVVVFVVWTFMRGLGACVVYYRFSVRGLSPATSTSELHASEMLTTAVNCALLLVVAYRG